MVEFSFLNCIITNDNIEITYINYSLEFIVQKIDNHHSLFDIFHKFTNSTFNSSFQSPFEYNINRCDFN